MRIRYDRNLVFWILILSLTFLLALPISAENNNDEIEKIREELDSLEDRKGGLEHELDEAEQEKNTTRDRLMQTQQELETAEAELRSIENDIDATEEEIEIITEKLKETEEELDEKETFLAERLKASYQNGNVSYLEVLFEADSFIDLLSRLNYINKIVDKDVELIEEVEEQRDIVQAQKDELEEQENELQTLLADAESQKETIEAREIEQRRLLSELEDEVREYEQRLAQKEQEAKEIEEMLASLQTDGDGLSPPVEWPVANTNTSNITSPYGNRTHPVYNVERFHTGVDIGAPEGTSVLAAESGTVVQSGISGSLQSGYGRIVIIDHGDGYSTLYAHNSENLVSEGEEVSRGETIARIGATGTATGPHLHFEVLVNGEHTNPMEYLQ
ncbi:murein hydrolase activator EnvC family protein [Natranaerofaba carboxydovora]|uniref:murein hydrolase activator EnvC family protein n=1 Tax=Natranaerofaba carboxydovora TaxID=2742683 RepID=UPI001F13F04B|nr:M23 family metallopeptidase [Natranaerofaba carboxydovora]